MRVTLPISTGICRPQARVEYIRSKDIAMIAASTHALRDTRQPAESAIEAATIAGTE